VSKHQCHRRAVWRAQCRRREHALPAEPSNNISSNNISNINNSHIHPSMELASNTIPTISHLIHGMHNNSSSNIMPILTSIDLSPSNMGSSLLPLLQVARVRLLPNSTHLLLRNTMSFPET
jgi:hypothetical protein